ncbi:HpcH/HpaI aldolase/citrate lyase family protein [Oceanicola sp. S124]|uniref:HpcH/HpaI aldolase/citrate lyase family protein n=1 Tax=Oceanicola sp. S124 TaxID=1042378 RepID=UPI0002559F09|nr:CoA ester lyase [Oceanicola sp. S124]
MDPTLRPYRSLLYIPGSKERALDKARSLPVDAILFDLEDAVMPDAKHDARRTLCAALEQGGYGARARIVRINGLDTGWGADDVAALRDADIDALLLPKVATVADIDRLAALCDCPIWTMMETPLSIFNAQQIAAHPRVQGLVAGTNDLAKELGSRDRPDRLPLQMALQTMLLAARAHGVIAADGVYNQFTDAAGLEAECAQGRDLGFDGKTLIHPAQIEIANRVFAPSEAEISLARRQIAAFDEVLARRQGVAVVDGKIVENLHVETAKKTLARAEAIAPPG